MTDTVDAPSDATPDELLPEAADETVVADAPVAVVPDRADSPVSEVTERFLRAVVAQVPLELIEELHLFSPLRQGTVETGIAVLAARVPVPVAVPVAAEPEPELALDAAADVEGTASTEGAAVTEELLTTEHADDADRAADTAVSEDVVDVVEEVVAEEAGDDEVTTAVVVDDAVAAVHEESVLVDESSDDEDVAVIAEIAAPPAVERHTVYTARYRYIIKGPERGKWEASVKAEADAPLITVETVVRGVQRRAGEESEIVRFTQAQIAKALRVTLG